MLFSCILPSLALASIYVLSLYVWNSDLDRDHPETIKRRFISAASMLILSPPFVWLFGRHESDFDLLTTIGVRSDGLLNAVVLPLILTMALFIGPICASGRMRFWLVRQPEYWRNCFSDLIWWRNHVVAPFTEELTFRACMLPILLKCASPFWAVIVAPLFFGTAHLHHMVERVSKKGQSVGEALFISLFQMTYTTVFGAFSAFLFLRTGHLASAVVVHGFCNFMGFPDFNEVNNFKGGERIVHIALYFVGIAMFYQLLFPLTEPALFANTLYQWP